MSDFYVLLWCRHLGFHRRMRYVRPSFMIGALLGAGYTNLSIVLLQLFVILFAFFRLFVTLLLFLLVCRFLFIFCVYCFPMRGHHGHDRMVVYDYLCNQWLSPLTLWVWIPLRWGVHDTILCDNVCQWLATGRWFFLGTLVSSTNKTDRHDIAEILLKVALNTIALTPVSLC